MRRSIPWVNLLLTGSPALFLVAFTIYSVVQGQGGEALIALIACTFGFCAVTVIIFTVWWFSRPTYITKQGVGIWTVNDTPNITVMERYLDLFVDEMFKAYPLVSMLELKGMLDGTAIEWSTSPVSMVGIGWVVKGKAGLQSGKHLRVQLFDNLCNSALTHELAHEVQEVIQRRDIDYEHKDALIWRAVNEVEAGIKQRLEVAY